MNCPLCNHEKSVLFHKDAHREYKRCPQCALVFVPKEQRLTPEKEKAVYDLHQNNPHDQGYRKFLSRLFDPIVERVQPGVKGLDFGCGPGPTLGCRKIILVPYFKRRIWILGLLNFGV